MAEQQDSDGLELKLVGEFNRIQGYKGDEHHLMARAAIEAMSRQLAEKDAEIARLLEYAREASKELTHHAGGGSEMFLKIGDQHYADPKLCRERIWHRNETAQRLHDATIEAMSRQLVEAREALNRIHDVTLTNNSATGKLLAIEAIVSKALEGSAP